MGSLTAGQYSPYDPGGHGEIFTLDPLNPARRVGEEPPDPAGGLLGLLALGLGYWAMRRSVAPGTPAATGAPAAAPAEGSSDASLENKRRVTNLTDRINGGAGPAAQNGPATLNRAAQLAGLPYGGVMLGQRTPFPPVVAGADTGNLPAVLRGANMDQSGDAATGQAPTNQGAGWQDLTLLRPPLDFPDIPDFLRRTEEKKDNGAVQPERPRLGTTGPGGGGVGGGNDRGGGRGGGNDDDCNEDRNNAQKICVDAYADGWNGNYTAWRSNYRVGPYKKESGGRWTIQDCMKGLMKKECGGEDPDDEENRKKHAWRPRIRRSPKRRGGM